MRLTKAIGGTGKLAALVAMAVAGRSASASVKDIGSEMDTTIFQNNVNNSAGGAQAMFAGTNGTSSPRRGLIEFDIADNIPAGSTITGAQLTLYLVQVAGSGGGSGTGSGATLTISLYKLSDSWGEGTAESNTSGASGNGQGTMANNGDATWDARFYPSPTWTTPGGDFAATASGSASVGTTLNAPYTWGSTSGMVADVQSWLDSPTTNFGWELINADETDSQTFRAFWTREEARTDPTAALVPQLAVTYVLAPEPVAGVGLSVLGLLALRRRRSCC